MNKTIIQIDTAIKEAQQFIQKASAWKKRLKSDSMAGISGSKEGGACKRASMDLTRALVDIRKPWTKH